MNAEQLAAFRDVVSAWRAAKIDRKVRNNVAYLMAVRRVQRAFGGDGVEDDRQWMSTIWPRLHAAIAYWGQAS